jgi:proline dehydrogenase
MNDPAQAAQVLRTLALDEKLKHSIPADPVLGPLARKVARRYVAGEDMLDAIPRVTEIIGRGHRANAEYMGESCRDATLAARETDVFVSMADKLPAGCSVSLDLSHIGLAISTELAEATAATGREMIISAEGSGRTDAVLAVHRGLSERFSHVGVTVQARLHRSPADLAGLLPLPGRIRLVKGAFLEPETIAYARDDAALTTAYLAMAGTLAESRHLCSFATHDWELIHQVEALLGEPTPDAPWEFETLLGLGPDRLAAMAAHGHPTREYVVFGTEWWLYVCNRLAEDPTRLFQALTDAAT